MTDRPGTLTRRQVLTLGGAAAVGTAVGLTGPSPAAAQTRQGLDYGWVRPDPSIVRASGHTFACRYVSWDTSGKNLTRGRGADVDRGRHRHRSELVVRRA